MSDSLKTTIARFIKSVMHQVDYLALYPCKIVAQNADFTLELKPDNAKMPGFSKVPIKYGHSGVAVRLSGGRCLLGFENGNPASPVACLFSTDGMTTIYLGGQQPNGSDVTQMAAIAEKVQQALDDIKAAFNSHSHSSGALVAPSGGGPVTGATAGPVSPIGTLGPVAAANVKVK